MRTIFLSVSASFQLSNGVFMGIPGFILPFDAFLFLVFVEIYCHFFSYMTTVILYSHVYMGWQSSYGNYFLIKFIYLNIIYIINIL